MFKARSERGAQEEPEEYVGEYKQGRGEQEDEQSGGALVPNLFPLYVLGLFLEEVSTLVPNACRKAAYLIEKALDLAHNVCHIYLRSS